MIERFWGWRWRGVALSVVFWLALAGALRVTVATPEDCGYVNVSAFENGAREAAAWMVRNQDERGMYVYEVGLGRRVLPDYNEVRHAGVTLALYEAAGRFGDVDTMRAADRGLDWMLRYLVSKDGWSALSIGDDRLKLGATALMEAALAERRTLTRDTRYDSLMRELGRFMLLLQREDGGFFIAVDASTGEVDRQGISAYYPGEALWALAMLHNAFPNEGWDTAARRTSTYLSTVRDKQENLDIPDHWMAYALSEMVAWGLTPAEQAYTRTLAERFEPTVRQQARLRHSPLDERFKGIEARAASLGTRVEGLSALWRVVATDASLADLEPGIVEHMTCAAGILTLRQVPAEAAAKLPEWIDPGTVQGAWFTDSITRMDDQQHALSGLLYTVDALNGKAQRSPVFTFLTPR